MTPISPEDKTKLAPSELADERLDDWRLLAGRLHARFRTRTFTAGVQLVDRIAAAADAADHHPDVDLRYSHVDVAMFSHDVRGITRRDVRLARAISEFAGDAGIEADPAGLKVLGIALDTADADAIRPFWLAVLGLRAEAGDGDFLYDPDGHVPGLFLQPTDAHEQPRQRFHIDVDVPADTAQARIDAALAAGGTLVSEHHAPAWWTLADAQGNQVDIATWQGRD